MEDHLKFSFPVSKPYAITKSFGATHDGIDITGDGYDSSIFSMNDGTVYKAFYDSMNGNQIIIKHDNNIYSVYSHLNRILVEVNENIKNKQKIGTMGSTGMSTGVHLHFSIWNGEPYRGGVPIDPITIFDNK